MSRDLYPEGLSRLLSRDERGLFTPVGYEVALLTCAGVAFAHLQATTQTQCSRLLVSSLLRQTIQFLQ
jgi:hypothetical protein